jgi:hypothetical protein
MKMKMKKQMRKLHSARPHLICYVKNEQVVEHGAKFDVHREIMGSAKRLIRAIDTEGASNWGELIEEGFDLGSTGSKLAPVYFCHVIRAGEMVSLLTFTASRDHVLKLWGSAGLDYCDPITGTAFARIEVKIPKGADLQSGDQDIILAAAELAFVRAYEKKTEIENV